MKIFVNEEILKKSIVNLEKNKNFLVIDNNLFSINNISTMINIKSSYDIDLYDNSKFMFTYDYGILSFNENNEDLNSNINKIEIIYNHEETTCQSFINLCKLISDDDVNKLLEKAEKISYEKFKNINKIPSLKETDEIFYNEVLVFISSKINENDKIITTDDFISKFELYKEKQTNKIEESKILMNKLYDLLLNIKLNN